MPENNLDTILARLKANDQTVLKELFSEYYQSVCNTIFRFIKDRAQVEDIAQDTFVKIWEKRTQLNIQTSFGAYLHRMAVNEAISFLRKHQRTEKKEEQHLLQIITAEDHSGETQYLYQELESHISAAIDQLPPKCRTIFILSRFDQKTYKEIAQEHDISIKTVENQMGKALKILRAKLKPYLDFLIFFFFYPF